MTVSVIFGGHVSGKGANARHALRINAVTVTILLAYRFFKRCAVFVVRDVKPVHKILVSSRQAVEGVLLEDGTEIRSKLVLSNATAKVTFIDLLDKVRLLFSPWRQNNRSFCVSTEITMHDLSLLT